MFLRQIDLTTALRPSLLPDETLLFVQDAVGLYDGKFKLPEYQNGQAYLTSHRVCYIDNEEPRKRAVAVHLKEVDRCELYVQITIAIPDDGKLLICNKAGFLKSSPKIILHAKAITQTTSTPRSTTNRSDSAASARPARENNPRQSHDNATTSSGTWICPICSFSNPVPTNFDPAVANSSTPLPPCLNCGIKPPLVLVVKASLAGATDRHGRAYEVNQQSEISAVLQKSGKSSVRPGQCPRCTFNNDPAMTTCEMCNASLGPHDQGKHSYQETEPRADSPGPYAKASGAARKSSDSMKLSFRGGGGGEKVFLERLKGALVQRKWLLQSAPPVPKLEGNVKTSTSAGPQHSNIGIAGLERRGIQLRKNNELVIGNAFEDLAALMASAKEIIALAESFASQTKNNPVDGATASDTTAILSQLNLITTKDMLGTSNSNNLYLTELSRSLAEFLTDDAKGILRSEGGIISLVDLWAVFNRSRGGVELVSPTDLAAAADLFDKLKLPTRLRRFRSGLLVVQDRSRTDEKTVNAILAWLGELQKQPPEKEVSWDWTTWGRGVTAQETAERFGWSVGVAIEELEMAEERGSLCRENALEGVRFWKNFLVMTEL